MRYRYSRAVLRERAGELRGVADRVSTVRSKVLSVLASAGRYSPSNDALRSVVAEADARAVDFDARASFLEELSIAHHVALPVSTVAARAGIGPEEAARLAATAQELQHDIDSWTGSDNSPVLDEMARDLHAARQALGVTPEDLVAVAQAMMKGKTPNEADLPTWLFPSWYRDVVTMHDAGEALIGRLEAEAEVLQGRLSVLEDDWIEAHWLPADPDDSDRIHRIAEAMSAVRAELRAVGVSLRSARRSLVEIVRPSAGHAWRWITGTGVAGYAARQDAAGALLAGLYHDAVADQDYQTLAWVAGAMAAPDTTGRAAASFFNVIGVEATAGIPDFVTYTTSPVGDNMVRNSAWAPPGDVIELFSTGLAKASTAGRLSFSGAELIETNLSQDILERASFTLDASYLFVAEGFSKRFVVSAAAAYLPHAFVAPLRLHEVLGTEGAITRDSREYFFEEIARLGAGVELVLAVDDVGLLLNPEYPYADDSTLDPLAVLLEAVAARVDPVAGMPTPAAVAASEQLFDSTITNGVHRGLEAPMATVLAPYMDLLVPQEDHEPRGREAIRPDIEPVWPFEYSQAEIDTLIGEILATTAGADELQKHFFRYVAYQIAAAYSEGGEAAVNAVEDDLGTTWGRLLDLELDADVAAARAQDDSNRWVAIGIGAVTSLGLAAAMVSWPATVAATVASVGAGGALSVGAAMLAEAGWSTGNVERVLIDAFNSRCTRSDMLRYAVVTELNAQGRLEVPDEYLPPPLPLDPAPTAAEFEAWDQLLIEWRADFSEWAKLQDGLFAEAMILALIQIAEDAGRPQHVQGGS